MALSFLGCAGEAEYRDTQTTNSGLLHEHTRLPETVDPSDILISISAFSSPEALQECMNQGQGSPDCAMTFRRDPLSGASCLAISRGPAAGEGNFYHLTKTFEAGPNEKFRAAFEWRMEDGFLGYVAAEAILVSSSPPTTLAMIGGPSYALPDGWIRTEGTFAVPGDAPERSRIQIRFPRIPDFRHGTAVFRYPQLVRIRMAPPGASRPL
ncbi:MAG: hypothetical protein NTW86_08125 [Candidatus Sumerlaeota bacterium]|nr:hypothetical protein [Candidatus Sumerlaeota bacterium]